LIGGDRVVNHHQRLGIALQLVQNPRVFPQDLRMVVAQPPRLL
jgi:hypothetical protein